MKKYGGQGAVEAVLDPLMDSSTLKKVHRILKDGVTDYTPKGMFLEISSYNQIADDTRYDGVRAVLFVISPTCPQNEVNLILGVCYLRGWIHVIHSARPRPPPPKRLSKWAGFCQGLMLASSGAFIWFCLLVGGKIAVEYKPTY